MITRLLLFFIIWLAASSLQAAESCDEAARAFETLAEAGGNRSAPAMRSPRAGPALHELADCLINEQSYEEAIQALELIRTQYPPSSFCGTCRRMVRYRLTSKMATVYEHVGQYDRAVAFYLLAADHDNAIEAVRILKLYEAANQLDDLMTILKEEDLRYGRSLKKYLARWKESGLQPEMRPPVSRTIRRLLSIRKLEDSHSWNCLIRILLPTEPGTHDRIHEVKEAALILARHPEETVPLLLGRLTSGRTPSVEYALGLSATPEAVAVLAGRMRNEGNYHRLTFLARCLRLAGERGLTALESIPSVSGLDPPVEDRRRKTFFSQGRDIGFPPIPDGIVLPNACKALYPQESMYTCAGMCRERETFYRMTCSPLRRARARDQKER